MSVSSAATSDAAHVLTDADVDVWSTAEVKVDDELRQIVDGASYNEWLSTHTKRGPSFPGSPATSKNVFRNNSRFVADMLTEGKQSLYHHQQQQPLPSGKHLIVRPKGSGLTEFAKVWQLFLNGDRTALEAAGTEQHVLDRMPPEKRFLVCALMMPFKATESDVARQLMITLNLHIKRSWVAEMQYNTNGASLEIRATKKEERTIAFAVRRIQEVMATINLARAHEDPPQPPVYLALAIDNCNTIFKLEETHEGFAEKAAVLTSFLNGIQTLSAGDDGVLKALLITASSLLVRECVPDDVVDLTYDPHYASVVGFTVPEAVRLFSRHLDAICVCNGWVTSDGYIRRAEVIRFLRDYLGRYHFSFDPDAPSIIMSHALAKLSLSGSIREASPFNFLAFDAVSQAMCTFPDSRLLFWHVVSNFSVRVPIADLINWRAPTAERAQLGLDDVVFIIASGCGSLVPSASDPSGWCSVRVVSEEARRLLKAHSHPDLLVTECTVRFNDPDEAFAMIAQAAVVEFLHQYEVRLAIDAVDCARQRGVWRESKNPALGRYVPLDSTPHYVLFPDIEVRIVPSDLQTAFLRALTLIRRDSAAEDVHWTVHVDAWGGPCERADPAQLSVVLSCSSEPEGDVEDRHEPKRAAQAMLVELGAAALPLRDKREPLDEHHRRQREAARLRLADTLETAARKATKFSEMHSDVHVAGLSRLTCVAAIFNSESGYLIGTAGPYLAGSVPKVVANLRAFDIALREVPGVRAAEGGEMLPDPCERLSILGYRPPTRPTPAVGSSQTESSLAAVPSPRALEPVLSASVPRGGDEVEVTATVTVTDTHATVTGYTSDGRAASPTAQDGDDSRSRTPTPTSPSQSLTDSSSSSDSPERVSLSGTPPKQVVAEGAHASQAQTEGSR